MIQKNKQEFTTKGEPGSTTTLSSRPAFHGILLQASLEQTESGCQPTECGSTETALARTAFALRGFSSRAASSHTSSLFGHLWQPKEISSRAACSFPGPQAHHTPTSFRISEHQMQAQPLKTDNKWEMMMDKNVQAISSEEGTE